MSHQVNQPEIETAQSPSLSKITNKSAEGFTDRELLRLSISGVTDEGESKLINRLFHYGMPAFEKQLNGGKEADERSGVGKISITLRSGGHQPEEERGITKDAAYHSFATPKRRFILAGTQGQTEYTRNLVTGASPADAAILLVDTQNSVADQTNRHSYIASLLQIPDLIIAIENMDQVNFSEEVYKTIKSKFEEVAGKLMFRAIHFIPISTKEGDNLVEPSANTPWYQGETLMSILENLPILKRECELNPRFPVQNVIESTGGFPGHKSYTGEISGGFFSVGDNVLAIPSNRVSIIKAIDEGPVTLSGALTPQLVTICLEGDPDIKRGDMIVRINRNYPKYSSVITLQVCWLHDKPLSTGKKYIIRHTTDETVAVVTAIRYKVNMNTLDYITGIENVLMNEIAHITIKTMKPLKYDDYRDNRMTGRLILIDENTFETVGAGMIVTDEEVYSYNI